MLNPSTNQNSWELNREIIKPGLATPLIQSYSASTATQAVAVQFHPVVPSKLDLGTRRFESAVMFYDGNLASNVVECVSSLVAPICKRVEIEKFEYGSKNLDSLTQLWQKLSQTNPDVLIGVGGGVVCDLTGLAAGTFKRGIPHILFPTTMLSMMDASFGGKTGIDMYNVKNIFGVVHHPHASIAIVPFLESLPYPEYISAFSEAVKNGMMLDKAFFQELSELISSKVFPLDSATAVRVIYRAASLKIDAMQVSTLERRKLLYGHTIGHALECYDDSRRRHGDCVAIGINYEAAVGVRMGLLDESVWATQLDLLRKLNLPTRLPITIDYAQLAQRICSSKMNSNGEVMLIVPNDLGVSDLNGSIKIESYNVERMLTETDEWLNDHMRLL